MKRVVMRKPDDLHCHFRKIMMLIKVLPFTAQVFARGVAMMNFHDKPGETADEALEYRREIMTHRGANDFEPILSIMLTRNTTPAMVKEAALAGVKVLKMIPGSASTNSGSGISLSEIGQCYPHLAMAQTYGMVFSGHWELPELKSGKPIEFKFREEAAIPYADQIARDFPGLRIVFEHVSSIAGLDFVKEAPANVFGTQTVHHPFLTEADLSNPHHFCLPVAKTEADREALELNMVSGNKKFGYGGDSAPHYAHGKVWRKKKGLAPPAGIFTAPVALSLLAEIFERHNCLEKLESFTSEHGADFYGLPRNKGEITLIKKSFKVPHEYEGIAIFKGGEILNWQVA